MFVGVRDADPAETLRSVQYEIEFGGEPQDVTVTVSGRAELGEILRLVDELAAHPRFERGMAILFDTVAADVNALTADDIRTIADAIVRGGGRLGRGAAAVLAPAALAFGLSRMLEAYAHDADLRLRTFSSRDQALAWLRAEAAT